MASVRTRGRRYMVVHKGRSYGTYPTRDAAQTTALDVELRDRLGVLYREAPETFGAALDRHLARKENGYRPATLANLNTWAKRLDPLRHHQIPALRTALAQDTVDDIARTAPVQAARCLRLLKAVLKEAQARGQQVDLAVFTLRPPKHVPAEGKTLTLEQAHEIGSWLPGIASRLPAFALLTGLRQGELFNLRREDWDRKAHKVHIREGKTDAARRTVDLGAEVHRILVAQAWEAKHSPWLFPNTRGGQWTRPAFNRQWTDARATAGLPGFRFHWLRHTYITLCRRAGVPVEVIARQVGHKDGGALIFRTYRHVSPDEQVTAARLLDAYLGVAL